MKRAFPSLCLAAVFAVGLSAQTPSPTPSTERPQTPTTQTPTTSPGQSSMAGQRGSVTLTGCVKEGDQPNTYVLSDIKKDTKSPSSTAGTSGSAASMPDMSGKTLRLTGASASSDLKAHVGHTVSVTGMMAPQSGSRPMGTTGTPSTTPPSTTSPDASSASGPSLNVSSVSMVSSTCSM